MPNTIQKQDHMVSDVTQMGHGWPKKEIYRSLNEAGSGCTELAKVLGLSPTFVRAVVSRNSTSHKVANAICKVIGQSPAVVFADKPQYAEAPLTKAERIKRTQELLAEQQ